MHKIKRDSSGFTLIELLVVVSITALLASYFATPWTVEMINQKRTDVAISETAQIQNAALSYRADRGSWPGGTRCSTAINQLTTGGYLANIDSTNAFNKGITTSCTSTIFTVTQSTLPRYGGYLANGLAASTVTNVAAGTVASAVNTPGSEPALVQLLDLAGTRSMRGTLNMGGNSIANAATVTASRLTATTDVRAPRVYDSNNTGYYLDAASRSQLNLLDITSLRDRNNTAFYVDPASTSVFSVIYADLIYDRNNAGYYLNPASTSKVANLYANILYDGNDANYYVNANSTSVVHTIRLNYRLYDHSNTSYYIDPAATSRLNNVDTGVLRLRSNYGVGGSCTSKQVGTTSSGELLSCVSGRWRKTNVPNVTVSNGYRNKGSHALGWYQVCSGAGQYNNGRSKNATGSHIYPSSGPNAKGEYHWILSNTAEKTYQSVRYTCWKFR